MAKALDEWLERRRIVKEHPKLITECTLKAIAGFCTKCGEPTEICQSCKVAELSYFVGAFRGIS
jgi:hypothetical protein